MQEVVIIESRKILGIYGGNVIASVRGDGFKLRRLK